MSRHPSFGPVPPEEFHRAEKAPVPLCHEIIQKYVRRFGKGKKHRQKIEERGKP